MRFRVADADVDWVEIVNLDIDVRRIIIGHPDEITAKKISLGRQTHTETHRQKIVSRFAGKYRLQI